MHSPRAGSGNRNAIQAHDVGLEQPNGKVQGQARAPNFTNEKMVACLSPATGVRQERNDYEIAARHLVLSLS